MKRRSRAESDFFVHIDWNSSNEQPARKVVKMEEGETTVSSQQELQPKVTKLEKDFEIACRITGEPQVRERFLEDAGEKNVMDEQKKLTEVSTQLGETRKESADAQLSMEELKERLNCLTLLLDTERTKIKKEEWRAASLTQQLEAEKSRSCEDRKRAQASMDEMSRQHGKVNGELEKKVATLMGQLVAEKARSKEDGKRAHARMDGMAHQDVKVNGELEKKVATLTRQLEDGKARSMEDGKRAHARMDGMTHQNDKANRELEKTVATLTRQLEAQEAWSKDDRRRSQSRMDAMARQDDRVIRKLEKKVATLTRQLDEEKARSKEDRLGAQKRIDELLHMMAQQVLQQQLQPVSDENIVKSTEADAPKSSGLPQLQQYSDDEVQPPSIPRRFPLKKIYDNRVNNGNLSNSRTMEKIQKKVASLNIIGK